MSSRRFLLLFSLFVTLWTAACRSGRPTIVPLKETVEVEKIVTVVVNAEGTIISPVEETPVPTLALPTAPPSRPTPAEIGNKGEFTPEDLDKLFEVWSMVERDFYGNLPTDENLVDAMIGAMVEQLGDDFTNYYPAEVAKRINDGFRGDFEGIGAYVNTNEEGYFYIVRPIPNTPADRAGIKPGDIVIAVDGENMVGKVTDEVIAVVRGPKGEPVVLTIVRAGEPAPFDITIVRDQIIVPVVEAQKLDDGKIGYVQLVSFNQEATAQLKLAVETLIDDGITSLIFDLRDNGGGYLTEAVSVGDFFLPKGEFLIVRDSGGSEERYTTNSGDGKSAETIPLVVLINENSASASEIVSAALKERERAVLIGTNTFGKGSVQTPYTLDDGSEFRVTTARFYSPLDHVIHGVGVSPNIEFDFTPEFLGDAGDETVQRAVEYLKTGK